MDLRERGSSVSTRHPWETVRARFFSRLLVERARAAEALHVLDVGAGDGFVAATLLALQPPGSTITCFDPGYGDADLAVLSDTAPAGVRFTREAPQQRFDVIMLLDVLEHVENDRAFLRDLIAHNLEPRGVIVVSVPAHQKLFTRHDVLLGHHRRYSARDLQGVIETVGLRPRESGSLFGSLLVPRALAKVLERARGIESQPATTLQPRVETGVSDWKHGRLVTNAVRGALELDAWLCGLAARYTVPTPGLSVWTLCERAR